jgi:hypothetical protein
VAIIDRILDRDAGEDCWTSRGARNMDSRDLSSTALRLSHVSGTRQAAPCIPAWETR